MIFSIPFFVRQFSIKSLIAPGKIYWRNYHYFIAIFDELYNIKFDLELLTSYTQAYAFFITFCINSWEVQKKKYNNSSSTQLQQINTYKVVWFLPKFYQLMNKIIMYVSKVQSDCTLTKHSLEMNCFYHFYFIIA